MLYGTAVSGHAIRDLDASIAALEKQLGDLRACRMDTSDRAIRNLEASTSKLEKQVKALRKLRTQVAACIASLDRQIRNLRRTSRV